jgi:hypothetical protein
MQRRILEPRPLFHQEIERMTLVTLHRQAPVAPDAASCTLCSARITGTFQDHVLVGQPGTSQLRAVVCERCGDTLLRLVELCGPELSVIVQAGHPPVESLVGLPNIRPKDAGASSRGSTRRRLEEEADSLSRAERALRAEAHNLSHDT